MRYLDLVRGTYPKDTTDLPADAIIGNSFGTTTAKGSVNYALARYIEENSNGRAVIADTMLAKLVDRSINVHEITGDISNLQGGGIGTWGVLVAAHNVMGDAGLSVAEHVAQRYHIGRVGAQAVKAGILLNRFPDSTSMPDWFEPESDQIWTRGRMPWAFGTAAGLALLKRRRQI